jgi:nucleotide-binding universal stress UspA family protein
MSRTFEIRSTDDSQRLHDEADNEFDIYQDLEDNMRQQYLEMGSMIENHLRATKPDDYDDSQSQYLVEYLTSRALGVQCWFVAAELKKTESFLATLATRLRAMVRNFNGSEVADVAIQRQTAIIKDREEQVRVLTAMQNAARAAYLEMTGTEYGPASDTGKAHMTAAAAEASALAEKYAPKETLTEKQQAVADRRPMIYTDASGTVWQLNAEGRYETNA